LNRAHAHLGIYTGLDNYKNSWRRLGSVTKTSWRAALNVSVTLLVVHGDESAVLKRVNEHRAAGADHVCLQVLSDETNAPPYDEMASPGLDPYGVRSMN